jgi:hypothetical protein
MAIRGKEEKLGAVIDQLVGQYRLRAKLDEVQLHQWWDEILGPDLTRYTEALYLNGNRILVRISASAVRQELSYAKNKLISDINQRYGHDRITEIVFI